MTASGKARPRIGLPSKRRAGGWMWIHFTGRGSADDNNQRSAMNATLVSGELEICASVPHGFRPAGHWPGCPSDGRTCAGIGDC